MGLKLSGVELRAATKVGLFGLRQKFDDGLVVFRAPNSAGKSTFMQSVIYGLGLEGMLSPKHSVPLPHAMTDFLEDEEGHRHEVVESSVVVEIANRAGRTVRVQRQVKSSEVDTRLIRTWDEGEGGLEKDFYVRLPGAAQRDRGFHAFLRDFIGWDLPLVTRFEGDERPLYLEAVFPLFYVEQKHGWGGVQARYPTWYGIRDVSRRATEFVLNLEASSAALEVQRLTARANQLKERWATLTKDLESELAATGATARGMPREPTADWPPAVLPDAYFPRGDGWATLGEELERLSTEHSRLTQEEIPRVEGVAKEIERGASWVDRRC